MTSSKILIYWYNYIIEKQSAMVDLFVKMQNYDYINCSFN